MSWAELENIKTDDDFAMRIFAQQKCLNPGPYEEYGTIQLFCSDVSTIGPLSPVLSVALLAHSPPTVVCLNHRLLIWCLRYADHYPTEARLFSDYAFKNNTPAHIPVWISHCSKSNATPMLRGYAFIALGRQCEQWTLEHLLSTLPFVYKCLQMRGPYYNDSAAGPL